MRDDPSQASTISPTSENVNRSASGTGKQSAAIPLKQRRSFEMNAQIVDLRANIDTGHPACLPCGTVDHVSRRIQRTIPVED